MVVNILQKLSYRYSSHNTIMKYIGILIVNNRFIILLIRRPQFWDRFNFIIFLFFYIFILPYFILLCYLIYFPDFGLFWKKIKIQRGRFFLRARRRRSRKGEKKNNYF